MNCVNSSKPKFVAVYGRRRVGKTFLVKQLLGNQFCFYMTGVYECPRSELLAYFQDQLSAYSGEKRPRPKTWFEAFSQLRDYLSKLPEQTKRKETFRRATSTTKALHLTLITSCGLKWNAQADMIQSQVTLDDLF